MTSYVEQLDLKAVICPSKSRAKQTEKLKRFRSRPHSRQAMSVTAANLWH
ncbi:hypothetical protein H6G17_03310 [Chroococcidiopsis sp. FACHB-1243]|nr:hypothetical protein [Chroococcidiopsis sp. [FACHB-1243]]MBD2304547.1 hypothetical protein [Chroococcidiopsis sp. [FACHB-1243]]